MPGTNGHKSPASDAHARRIAELKRAFQSQLGQRPTTHQRTLRDRAAVWTALAEQAAVDPTVTWNDKVRLDHAAALARNEWSSAIARPDPSSLQALLAGVE